MALAVNWNRTKSGKGMFMVPLDVAYQPGLSSDARAMLLMLFSMAPEAQMREVTRDTYDVIGMHLGLGRQRTRNARLQVEASGFWPPKVSVQIVKK